MPKSKQPKKAPAEKPRSREEILADLRKNTVFIEKMKFAKEVFFPALMEASESIDDAKMNLSGISGQLMNKFLGLMKEKKFGELELGLGLDPASPRVAAFQKLLDIFNDMSVFDAKDQIEGMKNEIDLFINEEMKTRPLSSLTLKWLDEIDLK